MGAAEKMVLWDSWLRGSRRKRLGEHLASRHWYLLPAGPLVLRRPVETTDQSGPFDLDATDGNCSLCACERAAAKRRSRSGGERDQSARGVSGPGGGAGGRGGFKSV